MAANPLKQLAQLGQSIWLDYLRRDLITSGGLQRLVDEDDLRGVTSNPSIFQKAIMENEDYDRQIADLAGQQQDAEEMYLALVVQDIRDAADVLRPTWERLEHRDGYVSLECNPHLAYDTEGTVQEARRLWERVDRPNVFIKIPATEPGLAAIRRSIAAGININVTLLFGLERYVRVAEAYIAGLEARVQANEPIDDVHSVASFFLSRIDVLLDPQLQEIRAHGGENAELAGRLQGQVAIASAREAYRLWQGIFASERFAPLQACGARPQRLLWASTSTKNPEYPDVKYVDALVAPDTVNTLPLQTIEAYRDHGDPQVRIHDEPELTREALTRLPELGLSLDETTRRLEREGVEQFNEAYDKLMQALERKRLEAGETVPR